MAIVVEDGTGLEDANSYVSADDWEAFAENLNITTTYTDEAIEAALIKGTSYVDRTYEGRWPGTKVNGRDQALAWPREDATDAAGEEIASDEVPREVKQATLEAARVELNTAGTLTPTVSATAGSVKSQTVGPLSVEYFESSSGSTSTTRAVLPSIDDYLKNLLGSMSAGIGWLKRA